MRIGACFRGLRLCIIPQNYRQRKLDSLDGLHHMKLSSFNVLLPATVLLFVPATSPAGVTLINKGKSSYRIVIASDAIPSERHAADELQGYLEKMSGVKLPIATDSERPTSHEILLGNNEHLRKLKLKSGTAKPGAESFMLRTDGARLIILGGQPRGTLYGVYTLLEDKLGVRWFPPELEVVPKTNRVSLPALEQTQTPVLQSREVFWRDVMRDADFAARHRLNGNSYSLTEKHGGRATVYFPFVHSFDLLIPRELYKEHPEYFPLVKGQRLDGYVQRCLSNPEVLKLAVARVREWIRQHPEATIISVSQNDTANWCQCDQCKTLDDAEGSPSASLLRFVNSIAQDIEHDYPNVRIDTLAYQYTRKPPKTLRPRPNVIIRLCSIECCFAHPLATCASEQNRRFRDDIVDWQPIAPALYIWDYTPNFSHYQQPFPNFDALQPNVRFFVEHGVQGLFEQGNYSAGGNGEMGPLRGYLLARLLWNPNTDVGKDTEEFLNAYFGQAAPKIRAYIELLEGQVRDGTTHAHIFDSPTALYLRPSFLEQAEKILNEAEQAAENEQVRFRVQVARLPIWYVQWKRQSDRGEAHDELQRRFLQVARKAGISNISESKSLDDWAKNLERK